jgi:DNA-binding GntR family transcriptional regulator
MSYPTSTNGRITLASIGVSLEASLRTVVANSLVDQVTTEIRRSITFGTLPPGEQFSVTMLAEQLGVSHIPVREALRRLESEGLVTMRPARRAIVRPMNRHDVEGIYRLRKMIEPALARLNCELLTAEDLAKLEELLAIYSNEDAGIEDEIMAHEAFHLRLITPAASEWDQRILAYVWNANRRYARLLFDPANREARQRLGRKHHRLLSPAKSRSPDRLGAALLRHLEENEKSLLKAIGHDEGGALPGSLTAVPKAKPAKRAPSSRQGRRASA